MKSIILIIGVASLVLTGNPALSDAGESNAAEKTPLQKLQSMVVLNETGIISITYDEPWFYEVPEYASLLWQVLMQGLQITEKGCANVSQQLTDKPDQRLGPTTRELIDSLLVDGRVDDIRLISSALKPMSTENPVDPESSSDRGKYYPIAGEVCFDLDAIDPDKVGYMLHVFPKPEDALPFFQPICKQVKATTDCLDRLNVIDELNAERQGDGIATEFEYNDQLQLSKVSGNR